MVPWLFLIWRVFSLPMTLQVMITGHSIFWNFYSKFWAHIYKPLLCIFGQDVLQAKWKSSFRDIQNRDKYWLGFNFAYKIFRSSRSQMFFKIGVLKIFAFLIKLLAKKETPAQVFYFELCKIFQNIFFKKHLRRLFLDFQKDLFGLIFPSEHFCSWNSFVPVKHGK